MSDQQAIAVTGDPICIITLTVHSARHIVPNSANSVPDTFCGIELIGPVGLSQPVSYNEVALPGSFFEPTVYDFSCEWSVHQEHLDHVQQLFFQLLVSEQISLDKKKSEKVPICLCKLSLLRVLEKASLDNYFLKTTSPAGEAYKCLVEYSAFIDVKDQEAMSKWQQRQYNLRSTRAAKLWADSIASEVDSKVAIGDERKHAGNDGDDFEAGADSNGRMSRRAAAASAESAGRRPVGYNAVHRRSASQQRSRSRSRTRGREEAEAERFFAFDGQFVDYENAEDESQQLTAVAPDLKTAYSANIFKPLQSTLLPGEKNEDLADPEAPEPDRGVGFARALIMESYRKQQEDSLKQQAEKEAEIEKQLQQAQIEKQAAPQVFKEPSQSSQPAQSLKPSAQQPSNKNPEWRRPAYSLFNFGATGNSSSASSSSDASSTLGTMPELGAMSARVGGQITYNKPKMKKNDRQRPLRALFYVMRNSLKRESLRRFWMEGPPTTVEELLHGLLFRLPKFVTLNPSDTLQFNTRARYLWDAQFRPPELDPTSGLYITKATVYDYAMAELVEAFPSPPTDPNSSVPDRPLMSLEQFISGLESLKPFPAPRAVGGMAMSRSASVSASPAVSARGPTPGVLNPNQQKCVIQ